MQSNELSIKQFKHDMASPLAVFKTMIGTGSAFKESEKNVMNLALTRMENIISSLESTEGRSTISPYKLISEVLIEKKAEFKNKDISYKLIFSANAMNTLCHIQAIEFKRVMSNILNNSISAISDKGFIKMKGVIHNNKLIITITDNGHGINASEVSKVLDLGFSSKNSTGLGLYHAKKTVSKWRGDLRINSIFNLGTKVSLTIPISPTIVALRA